MSTNDFFKSKGFVVATWIVAGIIVLGLTFHAGIVVGARKATFAGRWNESYSNNFGGPRSGFGWGMMGGNGGMMNGGYPMMQAHGVFGQIIKIDGQSLVMKSSEGVEKVVLVTSTTSIRAGREEMKLENLKINDQIVVIGNPNDAGQIEARFIRLAPSIK